MIPSQRLGDGGSIQISNSLEKRQLWTCQALEFLNLLFGVIILHIQVRLLIFEVFSWGYVLIKVATFIDFDF